MSNRTPGKLGARLAMFEKLSKQQDTKPQNIQNVKAKKHKNSKIWEDKFTTAQPELTDGPQKVTQTWDPINDAIKPDTNTTINPGKIEHNFDDDRNTSLDLETGPKKIYKEWKPLNNIVTEPSVASITVNKLKKNESVEKLNVIIGEKQNTDEETNVEEILPQKSEEVAAYNEFDAHFNENGYFVLSKNKKTATFSKIGLAGAHDYQYYPACKVSRPIDASDAKSQVVTFKLFQYGWFGIGSDIVTPHGFPGYTDSGWMIRVSNGGSYYNDGGNVMGANATGDLTNQMVTMKYDPGTQQLTVITESRQEFVYTHKDMPTSKRAYFVFTMASGKVQLFDTNE